MPIVEKLMDSLVARYGKDKGETVYYAMEAEASGPFGKGNKHHAEHLAWAEKHGVRPITSKKPRTSAKRKPGAKRA
jgi:hypothetical protein